MKLFCALNITVILASHLPTILCRPSPSADNTSPSFPPLHLTIPSPSTDLWLNTTINGYPTEWPIHRTSIVLYIRKEARRFLKFSETMLLLNEATSIADGEDPSEPLEKTFEYQLRDNGPLFAIGPRLHRRDLKWGDVSSIVGGLIQLYFDKCGITMKCSEISFAIQDRARGALGSGVVLGARKGFMATGGDDKSDITSTS